MWSGVIRPSTEQFYEVTESSFDVLAEERAIKVGAYYNTVRPHQPLDYLILSEKLRCYNKNHGKEVMYH